MFSVVSCWSAAIASQAIKHRSGDPIAPMNASGLQDDSNHMLKKSSTNKYVIIAAAVIVASVALGLFFMNPQPEAEAAWYNDAWYHRKTITIGNSGSAAANQKVKIDIDTAALIASGKMRSDCADARFSDSAGNILEHFLDSSGGACNTSSTDFYILMEQIHGSGDTVIYFYYSNAAASDVGRGSQFIENTFSPTSGPTEGSEEVGTSPIGYWNFDEGNGSLAYNAASATGTSGVISGAFWQRDDECIKKTCLQFDGSDDVVTVTERPALNLTGKTGYSVMAWVKPFSDGENNVGEFIDKGSSTFMRVDSETGRRLDVQVSLDLATTDATLNISDAVSVNTWSHIAMVYTDDSDDEVTVYINGVARGTSSDGAGSLASETNNLLIGGDTAANFHGLIDEVKLYAYARSADDIRSDYTSRGKTAEGASAVLGESALSNQLTTGLVAHWRLDEGSWSGIANEVVDSSGSGYHGTASGNATTVAGKKNRAGTFDGTGDYADMGNILSFERTDSFSYSFWFKTSNTSHTIFGKMDADAGTYRGFDVFIDGSGRMKAHLINTVSTNSLSEHTTAAFNDSNWHHGAVTYDGSSGPSGLKLYVDSVERATTNDTNSLSGTIVNSVAFRIASRVSGQTFNGNIDDLRIYNRELSADEVRQLFILSGPLLHLKMDERVSGDAKRLFDTSSKENHTSSVDGANNTGMDCTLRGRYGYACDFDGTDDYICSDTDGNGTCDDDSDLDTLEQVTVMAWIKPDDLDGDYIVAGKVQYTNATNNGGFVLRVGNCCSRTDELEFDIGNNDWDYAYAQNIVTTNEWQHVVGVWDGSSMKIYRNGLYISNATTNATASSIKDISQEFGVGFVASSGVTTDYYNGMIDDVRVYDYALTNKEIIEAMNANHPFGGSPNPSQRGYWKFDTGSGSFAYDSGMGGNHGILTAGASGDNTAVGHMWDKGGYVLSGIDFDGTDDYIEMSDTYDPAAYTISAWVKPTDITSTSIFLRTSSSGPTTSWSHQLRINASSQFEHYTNDGTAETLSGDTVITAGLWYHVVGVAENSGTMRLYVNGKEEGTPRSMGTTLWTGGDRYRIGSNSGGSMGYFDGIIDEVKLYPVVLSAAEIEQEYLQDSRSVSFGSLGTDSDGTTFTNTASREYCVPGDTATCSAPVGEWKFEERVQGDSKTLFDSSGNNYNATTVDGANNTGMDCAVRGKTGMGCTLDGTDDYIDIGTGPSGVQSISFWVYPETTTEYFINLTGTTDYIWVNSGTVTATGLTSPTIYVNGAVSSTLIADQWQHVTITTGTAENASNLDIGRTQDTNYLEGTIDQVRLYDYARSAAQVAWEYNRGAPVGWWKFDECEGTTAYDWAPGANGGFNGNNGAITIGGSGSNTSAGTCTSGNSAHAWYNGVGGKRNYSLDFDGTDDVVTVTNATTIDLNGALVSEFTVGAWVNVDSDGENNAGEIIDKGANTYIRVDSESGNTVDLEASLDLATSDATLNISNALTLNTWHYVTLTWTDDGDDEITLWVDGRAVGVSTNGSGAAAADANNLLVGGSSTANFDGQIDDVRIYNYALTQKQIEVIMNEGGISFEPESGAP